MSELFVYYRCRAGDTAAVGAAAGAMQQQLRARIPGLEARLLRHPAPAADATVTWMETYRLSTGVVGDDASWQPQVHAAAAVLEGWIVGRRHVEVFEPCAW